MNVKKWVWCLHCQRAFEVFLSREPIPPNDAEEEYG